MIGIILSAIAAFLLFALAAYLLVGNRDASQAAQRMLAVCFLLLAGIEMCDRFALLPPFDPLSTKKMSLFLESLLPGAFLFFSLTYARRTSLRALGPGWMVLLAVSMLFPTCLLLFPEQDFFYSHDFASEQILFLGAAGYWLYTGVMLFSVISLLNVEATFVATTGADRWKVKYEAVGVASVLAVLIFYFSQGLLYRTINMNLMPVRSAVLIIASTLVLYSKAFRGNNVQVTVSRHVFYRSFTLLSVGFYLLVLGLVGEGMRYLDVPFGRNLTIFLAFASGIAMVILFLSERLRRRVKVYINKHFYANRHDHREAWLSFTARLAACRTLSDIQAAVLTTFKETFDLSGVSLYLLDGKRERYVPAASHAMPDVTEGLRMSPRLLFYFKDRDRVYKPFLEYAPTPGEADFMKRACAEFVVPLICNQEVAGLVLFGKPLGREEFNYEDYDLMKALARQSATFIVNARLSEELMETREMAAVARISSFVIHDLKNLVYTLSLVVENAQEHMENPEFQRDMITTIRCTLAKMKNLIERLRTIPEKNVLQTEWKDVHLLSRETVESMNKSRPGLHVVYKGSHAPSRVDADEIRKVIVNIVQNAADATAGRGAITVETGSDNGSVYIRISDKGCGMTDDFIKHHLFKPFRTTKEKGLGIGLYQCRQIVEAHGGAIDVKSEVGRGTTFTVTLPIAGDREGVLR